MGMTEIYYHISKPGIILKYIYIILIFLNSYFGIFSLKIIEKKFYLMIKGASKHDCHFLYFILKYLRRNKGRKPT